MLALTLLISCVACAGTALAQPLAEQVALYQEGPAKGYYLAPWNQQLEQKSGGVSAAGKHLWLNADCKAKPWAGLAIHGGEGFALTEEWLATGFVRFLVNIGVDRYGNIGGGVRFQVKAEVEGMRYQAVRAQFIDRGRGTDEDTATWQEVLIPLSYWTDLKPGMRIKGLSIQCVQRPERSFGFDEIGFVRFVELPAWYAAKGTEEVAQPWVTWPAYDDLPELLKADRHPPVVRGGKFVWPDGKRVFILNPYCREDARLDIRGGKQRSDPTPNYGLYDPAKHGWIYDDCLTAESVCRLGFNSYSATMPPGPFWKAVGYPGEDGEHDVSRLPAFAAQVSVPFYVDLVSWPWTLGKPGEDRTRTALPAEALTEGGNHWTQYRTLGKGRETWLTMWRTYAQRYRDAGVPVLVYELMNEPAYVGVSDDHVAEFEQWLRRRYETLARLNSVWGTEFTSWAQAARPADSPRHDPIVGRFLDFDEYHAGRFTELIEAGVGQVTEIDPGALVGVQPMGGYALWPREGVWKHWLAQHETVVLTPTGGGRWTGGRGAAKPTATSVESPMAPAPLEDDLLLALAGTKMLYDNETYLRGQTRLDTRNRLWEQVLAGLDGLSVFSWSKRGWAWFRDRATVQTEADKFPYSALNPLARRTEALRGILDFAQEVQPLAEELLPKPWGPEAKVGLLWSWAQARRHVWEPETPDKTADYYAALKYTHWNLRLVPSDHALAPDGLNGLDALILGGVRHLEPELVPVLTEFVQAGGTLVIGEEPAALDQYGNPLPEALPLGVTLGETRAGPLGSVLLPSEAETVDLSGEVAVVAGLRSVSGDPDGEVVCRLADGTPVVTRHSVGRGQVFFQAAEVTGYGLAKLLCTALNDGARRTGKRVATWRLAEIREGQAGTFATNVLLSRRSRPGRETLLLMNMDEYEKSLTIRLPDLAGQWQVTDGLTGGKLPGSPATGLTLEVAAGCPAVILLRRR